MRNLWVLLLGILLLFSCSRNQNKDLLTDDAEEEFRAEELPERVRTNAKANEILKDWEEFNAFDTSFDALYNASNSEDLILVTDDLIEKQKLWENSEYPEDFDIAQIKSRQMVMKTYILKLKSALDFRTDFTSAAIEMIDAYNALRAQYNVTMNITLDPELLSDEE